MFCVCVCVCVCVCEGARARVCVRLFVRVRIMQVSSPPIILARMRVLQVLLALQTHMFVANQMYNEPTQVSQHMREDEERARLDDERVLEGTLRHAILDMLQHPPRGFEAVVQRHFAACGGHLLAQVERWRREQAKVPVVAALLDQVEERIQQCLAESRPSECE